MEAAAIAGPAHWEPPTALEERQSGKWRLVHRYHESPVLYPMYRINQLDWLRASSAKETFLQEQDDDGVWHDWMTDQPPYWYAMVAYGNKGAGSVLVLGLGLGLVLRRLSMNPKVESVTICERQPEVIEMVWPQLDLDSRFQLRSEDFFKADWSDTNYDTIIADIWTGKTADRQMQELFLAVFDKVNSQWPDATAWYHGVDEWAKELTKIRREHLVMTHEAKISLLAKMAKQWA